MNIIILGAGAVGSFYGARLSKLNDVTLIAKKQHVDKINKDGLKIVWNITGLESKTYNIKAETNINKIDENTLILLTTKVYDSKKAISNIKNIIRRDTIILCLQNGLNSEDIVKDVVKNNCLVLRAVTSLGVVFSKPGIIKCNSLGYTIIENSFVSKSLVNNFNKCGLKCSVSTDIRLDVWKKLIFNCIMNPLTAILRKENRYIADKGLNPLKEIIVKECLMVATKDGIKFNIKSKDFVRNFVNDLNKRIKDSKNLSSMLQDLIKGNPTEIDYLNGAVVRLGKKYNIKCPVNQSLSRIIKSNKKNQNLH